MSVCLSACLSAQVKELEKLQKLAALPSEQEALSDRCVGNFLLVFGKRLADCMRELVGMYLLFAVTAMTLSCHCCCVLWFGVQSVVYFCLCCLCCCRVLLQVQQV